MRPVISCGSRYVEESSESAPGAIRIYSLEEGVVVFLLLTHAISESGVVGHAHKCHLRCTVLLVVGVGAW